MSYSVNWSHYAFNQMSRVLQNSPKLKARFAATLKKIALTLRTSPNSLGESREGNRRIWFVDNLLITYTVDDFATAVVVRSVRLSSTK